MSQPRHMLRDGRNIIPVSNSDAKCLLENWVEERAVKDIDPDIKLEGGITSKLQIQRHGNKGVLTTDFDAKAEDKTTVRITYTPPVLDTTRKVGSKKELVEKMHFAQVCKEKFVENDPDPAPTDFRSVKMVDYNFEFTPQRLPPTKDHNYRSEQPVTFWSEHKDKIHHEEGMGSSKMKREPIGIESARGTADQAGRGLTAVKTRDSAFRRNDSFTKPIWEWWEEPLPYDLENYPKM